jgi:hypothetical protein
MAMLAAYGIFLGMISVSGLDREDRAVARAAGARIGSVIRKMIAA